MDKLMVSLYANIFITDLDYCFLSSYPLKPLLYLRFIEDILSSWCLTENSLKSLLGLLFHTVNNALSMHFSDGLQLGFSSQKREIHFHTVTEAHW